MLITTHNEHYLISSWESMQQPVHGDYHQADTLRILGALDEGWQIQEAANYLARGNNAEGRGYLLTLYHPRRMQTREFNVLQSSDMDTLLANEGVPGINH